METKRHKKKSQKIKQPENWKKSTKPFSRIHGAESAERRARDEVVPSRRSDRKELFE